MARKNIFSKSLERTLSGDIEEVPEAPSATNRHTSGSPTVRRFRETYNDLMSQSIQEIDADRIGKSKYQDRFDVSLEISSLVESIRESGQQVPVLLRNAPEGADYEFEPVYGRRRIAACRELGIPVKAYVSDLDDDAMIVAQGLENAERLENSFIEKASFVIQLRESGIRGSLIEQALNIQRSEISRMNKVMTDVPVNLIDAIGPAHGVGRRQWQSLAKLTANADSRQIKNALETLPDEADSPGRFDHVLKKFSPGNLKLKPVAKKTVAAEGRLTMTVKDRDVVFKVANADDVEFLAWLESQGEKLYLQWKSDAK